MYSIPRMARTSTATASSATQATPVKAPKSSKKTATATESVVAPVVVVDTAPVVEKAPKAKKSKAPKAEAEVAAPVSEVVAPKEDLQILNEVVSGTDSGSSISAMLADLEAQMKASADQQSKMKATFRALSKVVIRADRIAQKAAEKRQAAKAKRQPAGFTKPVPITDELAAFLGKPAGTLLSRTSVSKQFNQYFKDNNLQNPANKKFVNPDEKLIALLKLEPGAEFGYFNLQHYLSPLFVKATSVAV
jgi:upstream activation factor subunit UAF30